MDADKKAAAHAAAKKQAIELVNNSKEFFMLGGNTKEYGETFESGAVISYRANVLIQGLLVLIKTLTPLQKLELVAMLVTDNEELIGARIDLTDPEQLKKHLEKEAA